MAVWVRTSLNVHSQPEFKHVEQALAPCMESKSQLQREKVVCSDY